MIVKLLMELCEQLENNLNSYNESQHKMPNNRVNYVFRSMKHVDQTEHYAGIYVNKKLIFKQVHYVNNTETDQLLIKTEEQIREDLAKRILVEVFNYGVMASKKEIDDYEQINKSFLG